MTRPATLPVLKTVLIATAAAAVALVAKPHIDGMTGGGVPTALILAAVAAISAGALARALRLGGAWIVLIVIVTPCLVLVPIYRPPNWIFLVAFAVLAGFYVNGVREKVPLYLSNHVCRDAIAAEVADRRAAVFIDLGCGLGGVIASVARTRPETRCLGVETAPLSFLIAWARIRMMGLENAEIAFRSIWETDVSDADVVYAFLSPAPMTRLNEKLSAEMKPGSLFISNSFAVPGREPDEVMTLDDARQTNLLLWRMSGPPEA